MSYKGIDYGLGKSNIDKKTGIRYGVIHQNHISPHAFEDIMQDGTDVDFEEFKDSLKDDLTEAIERVLEEKGLYYKGSTYKSNDPDQIAEDIVGNLEWDGYEGTGDCTRYLYEQGEYKIETHSDGDMFVLKSPFYSKSQFCSPCAPGAGYLESPCDDGPKTYCLDQEWFDKDCPCKYPIWRVDNDELVYSPAEQEEE